MQKLQLLEELINFAAVDGNVSDEERIILYKKADALGLSITEVDEMLRKKGMKDFHYDKTSVIPPNLQSSDRNKNGNNAGNNKCPNCGDTLVKGACPSCGYRANPDAEPDENEVNSAIMRLGNAFARVKSEPPIDFWIVVRRCILIWGTFGLYMIYRLIRYKEAFGVRYKDETFNSALADFDKEVNILENSHGKSNKLRSVLANCHATKEIIIWGRYRKKTAARIFVALNVLSFIILCFVLLDDTPERERAQKELVAHIDSLIDVGNVTAASVAMKKIEDTAAVNMLSNKLVNYKIGKLLGGNEYENALAEAEHITNAEERNAAKDDIINRDIYALLANNNFVAARLMALKMSDTDQRNTMIEDIAKKEGAFSTSPQKPKKSKSRKKKQKQVYIYDN